MLPETRSMLANFYEPYNQQTAQALGWESLRWGSTQAAEP